MLETQIREWKPTAEAEALYRKWIAYLNDQFTQNPGPEQRAEVVRDELYQIYLGRPHAGKGNAGLTSEMGSRVLAASFDPFNATIGLESRDDLDPERFDPIRPLIWFWQMFDRSPLGINYWLGYRFRCMLGHHIFRHMGKGVKICPDVRFTCVYNLAIEDNVTIGRGAIIDDSNELTIPSGTKIPAGARYPELERR